MELVYLWVDSYKNIENQGFNFSSRFECEFKDENLTICDKRNKDYIENFFGENINVTAIVGENGSGKSNILELISNLGYYEDPYRKKEYPVSVSELTQVSIYYDKQKNKLYIYKKNFTATINNKSSIPEEEITGKSIQKIFIKPTPSHSQEEYLLLLDFLRNNNHTVFPFEIPEIVSFGIHDDYSELLKPIENTTFNFYAHYTPFEENQKKRLKIFHILLLLAYLKNHKIVFEIKASENFDDTILELENKIEESIKFKIRSFIKTPLENFSVSTSQYINMKKTQNNFFKTYIEIIKRKNDNALLNFKGKNVFKFDLYPKMSDGQYQLAYIFNMIYSQIKKDTVLLCIDEGENYLHPNWQKKYINYLYKFLKDNFPNKQIHLIISSHSPFILSDIPKENVIFLKDGEQDETVNIDTFGANIHTLLSHGFFMQDGLMGEFAKSKINEIVEFHNKTKSEAANLSELKTEYKDKEKLFWHIKKIVGENYLKQVIKNHLIEIEKILLGNYEAKKEEIKRLEAQIEQLRK